MDVRQIFLVVLGVGVDLPHAVGDERPVVMPVDVGQGELAVGEDGLADGSEPDAFLDRERVQKRLGLEREELGDGVELFVRRHVRIDRDGAEEDQVLVLLCCDPRPWETPTAKVLVLLRELRQKKVHRVPIHRHCSAPDDIEAVPKGFY